MNFDQDLEGLVYDGQELPSRGLIPDGKYFLAPGPREKREWKEHWEGQGLHMMSMPELYKMFKLTVMMLDANPVHYAATNIRSMANHYIAGEGILTSTEILLKSGSMRIYHDLTSQSTPIELELPKFDTMKFRPEEFNGTKEDYLRALLGTKDSFKEICKAFEFISGIQSRGTVLFSPTRIMAPAQVFGLRKEQTMRRDKLLLTPNLDFNYKGHAFGVKR